MASKRWAGANFFGKGDISFIYVFAYFSRGGRNFGKFRNRIIVKKNYLSLLGSTIFPLLVLKYWAMSRSRSLALGLMRSPDGARPALAIVSTRSLDPFPLDDPPRLMALLCCFRLLLCGSSSPLPPLSLSLSPLGRPCFPRSCLSAVMLHIY